MGKHHALWIILSHFVFVCVFLSRNIQKKYNNACYHWCLACIHCGQKTQMTFDNPPRFMLSTKLVRFQLKQKAILPSTFHSCEVGSWNYSVLCGSFCCRSAAWASRCGASSQGKWRPLRLLPWSSLTPADLPSKGQEKKPSGLGDCGIFFVGFFSLPGRVSSLYLMQVNCWRQRNYSEYPDMRKMLPLDTWVWMCLVQKCFFLKP